MSSFKKHYPLVSFILFVFLSSLILIHFQTKAIKELKDRNDAILSHYERVLLLDKEPRKDEPELELDPIIEEFHFTPSQSMAFQVFAKGLIDKAVDRSHVDLEVESIVAAKSSAMYKETHDLLEMQFAKIQHETESLQIWCGILTIVFLIFSFYSLFKTDELVQSGKEYVKEISVAKETGNELIKKFRIEARGVIERFKSDTKTVLSDAETKIDGQKNELKDYLIGALKDSERELTDRSLKYLEGLDTKYADLSNALKAEWEHYMSDLKEAGTQDVNFKAIQELFSRVEALENK